ncbi:MAG: ribosome maturation factor RimP [Deltaproteobacteria bacterium]|nr:ribosome maturation factor RimP [Deltaproteobacteria bacterium]
MEEALLQKIETLASPVLHQMGYRLVEREFLNEHGQWVLRLYIEREADEKLTIDDCQKASHALGDLFDVEDVIQRAYTLEISSPGINRPLRYQGDFQRFAGAEIRLKTRYPIGERSNYKGTLEGIENSEIKMTVDGMHFVIPYDALLRAHLIKEIAVGKQKKMN